VVSQSKQPQAIAFPLWRPCPANTSPPLDDWSNFIYMM
jgi:hypothetical protein